MRKKLGGYFKKRYSSVDERVKKKRATLSTALLTFAAFGIFTTVQMHVLGDYIDYRSVSPLHVAKIVGIWLSGAIIFTVLTAVNVHLRYQKRIEAFAAAIRKVAEGDFSVYVPPRHPPERADHFDVILTDFNKMVEELGSIETLRTDFFSNVSHEIKTPLAVIQSNAELLASPTLSGEKRDMCIESIRSATVRLSDLITNMLKLDKLEKQVICQRPERFDLCAQLCECALRLEELWEEKGIDFEAELEDRAMITADEGLLELVWQNLLSNALKFTSIGGKVRMTQSTEGDLVTVRISDTGCGMSAETMAHIFDKFYQGDTSHATEGNGLGLALVDRIIQLSDGTVTVQSELGVGSVFTVRLPISPYTVAGDDRMGGL